MHSIDKKLIRKELGSFTLNGKRFKVFSPTLNQTLMHMEEAEEVNRQYRELIKDEELNKATITRLKWYKRELMIFVPELTEEEAGEVDEIQRQEIIGILFPAAETFEEGSSKEDKKKEEQAGEK